MRGPSCGGTTGAASGAAGIDAESPRIAGAPAGARLRGPADITDLLNYRLAGLVAASGAAVIRLCEGQYGISRREWHLLGLLAVHGAMSPSEMADQCHLDRARVSRAITRLTAKGLIRRQPLAADKRRASVALTPAGAVLQQAVFEDVARINARLVAPLSDQELGWLDDALQRLTEQARLVRSEMATTLRADRRRGGAARRQWPGLDDRPASDDPTTD